MKEREGVKGCRHPLQGVGWNPTALRDSAKI